MSWLRTSLLSLTLAPTVSLAQVPVGVILPLSGAGASYGTACRNGVTLALEELKDQIGDRFQVTFEDDHNAPPSTISALRSLQQKHQTKIFLTWASNTSNAVNQLADREGFIDFAIASDPTIPQGKKNVFSYWVSPDAEIRALVDELKKRHLKRIAIVTGQQDALLAFRTALQALSAKEGIEIVFSEEVGTELQDFKPILNKISKMKNVDGVFNNLYVGQTGIFGRQARELGIKQPLFGIEMYEDQSVIELSQGALEGQFYVNAPNGTADFIKRYSARFPNDSMMSSANCYDFVGLLAHTKDLSVDGVRKSLEELKDYVGAVGKVSASGDHRFTLPAVVKVIRGKEFITQE